MSEETPVSPILRASVYSIVTCAFAVPLSAWLIYAGFAARDDTAHGFFVSMNLFVGQDTWVGLFMALSVFAAVKWSGALGVHEFGARRGSIALLAVCAIALSVILRFLAHHNFPLSLDEFLPTFQAAIFRGGNLMAPLSDEALPLHGNIQPIFAYIDEERQYWIAHYRPIHAAILALFPAGYAQAAAHAILSGITVLALADITKRLFPDRDGAPVLAVLLLLASPQVLLTSSSGFAFTTHLAFNTVWLALFLRGTWTAHVTAAVVGFFALGIHQVHVHAIYVFPFGVAMLLGYFGDRLKTLPYIVAYGIGVPIWVMWPELATWLQTGDVTALPRTLLDVEYIANYIDHSGSIGESNRSYFGIFLAVNIWRFLLWMSPAVVLLMFVAIVGRRHIGTVPIICAIGFVFTMIMSHLLLPNQMHTIGSRYYHPVIGNLIVVCVATYYAYFDDARIRSASAALVVVGALIFLPWRSWQIHEKVGPRARVQAALEAMDVDSIVLKTTGVWFMPDFIRNDPYLVNRPVIYGYRGVEPTLLSDGPSVVIDGADLIEMGFPRGTWLEPALELSSR